MNLRARQNLGKYRITRRLGEGGFAVVYEAQDTIEGVRVALKVPFAHVIDEQTRQNFRHEVRIAARLSHPNILPLKTADYIEGKFVIVSALGSSTLEERLQKRLAPDTAWEYARQLLDAVAYAHEQGVIHCDIKPDNVLIFPDRIRLTDFGIARVAYKTIQASGQGTVGYMAPEQAMGRPSLRSDVFSIGVLMYRMFAGTLPEWPYDWPPPGYARLRDRVHPDVITLIQKGIQVDARKRFRDAGAMYTAFKRIKSPLKRHGPRTTRAAKTATPTQSWKEVRRKEFLRQYGRELEIRHVCKACEGPLAETMHFCPWCGKNRQKHDGDHRFRLSCPRCRRGLKSDWHYCPWCFGPGFEPSSQRELPDRRYEARCDNLRCERKLLMPFMKYCPWCRRKVRKKWKLKGSTHKCGRCGWGIAAAFWSYCPWCAKQLSK